MGGRLGYLDPLPVPPPLRHVVPVCSAVTWAGRRRRPRERRREEGRPRPSAPRGGGSGAVRCGVGGGDGAEGGDGAARRDAALAAPPSPPVRRRCASLPRGRSFAPRSDVQPRAAPASLPPLELLGTGCGSVHKAARRREKRLCIEAAPRAFVVRSLQLVKRVAICPGPVFPIRAVALWDGKVRAL